MTEITDAREALTDAFSSDQLGALLLLLELSHEEKTLALSIAFREKQELEVG